MLAQAIAVPSQRKGDPVGPPLYFLLALTLVLILLMWRFWAFTLSPLVNPKRPRDAPYWVPLTKPLNLRCKFKIKSQYTQFLTEVIRNSFDRTREPFSIRVFRERIYIISAPWDTTIAYKNSTCFSWDEYLDLLLRAFGIVGEALDRSWHNPTPNDPEHGRNPLNPQNKNLVHLIEDFYKIQLLPGEHLTKLADAYLDCLHRVIQWNGIPSRSVLNEGFAYKRLSLKLFVRTTMTEAITRAMLGDIIFDIEPEVVEQLMTLNDYSWAIIFNFPRFLTPKLKPAIKGLSSAIRTYLRSPDSKKADACWAVRSVMKSQEVTGLDEDSRVAMVLMIWWA
ncbi:hypothetical protein SLS56_008757 [Neofusicoccum ribis]|uniref:Cytochrome P450 n=1 Tax=Neofusicoccum ribis TaxID=45134 RepID=A0ABR3SK16_9PEZI